MHYYYIQVYTGKTGLIEQECDNSIHFWQI